MSAEAIVTWLGEPKDGWQGVRVDCSDCSHVTFTGLPVTADAARLLARHLSQHDSGRALDIEPEWVLSVDCSVCEDGGDVQDDGDVLRCADCGTTWHRDGTGGERPEPEGRES